MNNKTYEHTRNQYEDIENIIAATSEIKLSENSEKCGIPILSNGENIRVFSMEEPTLLIASTGSGKTRRMIIPTVLSCINAGENMVIHDSKTGIISYTYDKLINAGYKVIILNYRNPKTGDRYNLEKYPSHLYKTGQKGKANEYFASRFKTAMHSVASDKDPFWHATCEQYAEGLAEMACDLMDEGDVNISTIYDIHMQGSERMVGSTRMKEYFELHSDKPYYRMISPYVNAPNETRGSLDSVFSSAISKYTRNEDLIEQSLDSSFSVTDLIDKKTAVFILSRDESETYNDIISSIVHQIYQILIDTAEEKYNGVLPRKINMILDEFGNLAAVEDMASKISASRSRNISWLLCLQSLAQLNYKYGKDVAQIILSNCTNVAYMHTSDQTLLEYMAVLCGHRNDDSFIQSLRTFDKNRGQTLFLLRGLRPFRSELPDISKYDILPAKDFKIPERNPQPIKRFNFREIAEKERKQFTHEKIEKRHRNNNSIHVPSFEEFLADNKAQSLAGFEIKDDNPMKFDCESLIKHTAENISKMVEPEEPFSVEEDFYLDLDELLEEIKEDNDEDGDEEDD